MRLIDADALMKEFAEFVKESNNSDFADVPTWNDAVSLLGSAPTVDAITIDWLHHIMEKQLIFALSSEMEGTITVEDGVFHCVSGALACQVLANVIEGWEKENETN